MKKRLLSTLLALAMVLSMMPMTVFAADTGEGETDSGITTLDALKTALSNAASDGENKTVTLTQSITVTGSDEDNAVTGQNLFTDVAADAYYADAVTWAVANDITKGTSASTFSPNADCTRGQIVTFLYRDYAK